MTTRTPIDESERIEELARLCIVESDPHAALDGLVALVQRVLGAPMVVVALVDADRCWFKSRVGVQVPEVARASSPCSRVVLHNEELIVEDMSTENRRSTYSVGGTLGAYAGVPLRGPTGHPVGVLAVMSRAPRSFTADDQRLLRDFAAQAQAHIMGIGNQQRLAQATAQIDETRRLLSHDFKAPSRQVRSLLQLLGDEPGSDTDHIIALAMRSATTLQSMVDGFYEFSRVVPDGRVASVRLDDVLGQIWKACRPDERATLHCNVSNVVVPCRSGALQDVLHRVLDNALRHAGRPDVTVDVSAHRESGKWHVSVTDNGRGVSPDLCDAAFLMYRRLHQDTDRGGVGVGLPIARRLVLDAGATMGLRSDGTTGTTVWFTWPALPQVRQAAQLCCVA